MIDCQRQSFGLLKNNVVFVKLLANYYKYFVINNYYNYYKDLLEQNKGKLCINYCFLQQFMHSPPQYNSRANCSLFNVSQRGCPSRNGISQIKIKEMPLTRFPLFFLEKRLGRHLGAHVAKEVGDQPTNPLATCRQNFLAARLKTNFGLTSVTYDGKMININRK